MSPRVWSPALQENKIKMEELLTVEDISNPNISEAEARGSRIESRTVHKVRLYLQKITLINVTVERNVTGKYAGQAGSESRIKAGQHCLLSQP